MKIIIGQNKVRIEAGTAGTVESDDSPLMRSIAMLLKKDANGPVNEANVGDTKVSQFLHPLDGVEAI